MFMCSTARVTLTDSDLNLDPLRIDSAQVSASVVNSSTAQGSEILFLQETGFNTGVFTSRLRLTTGEINSGPNNGALDVMQGQIVRFTYRYVVCLQCAQSAIFMWLCENRVCARSQIHVHACYLPSVHPGSSTMIVREMHTRRSAGGIHPLVQCTSCMYSARNGRIRMRADFSLHLLIQIRRDAYPTIDVVSELELASVGILQVGPVPVTAGRPLTLTVTDADLNYLPNTAETGQVTVRTVTDTKTVTVTETGLNTNVFTGEIPTRIGGTNIAGTLSGLSEGGLIFSEYRDAIPDSMVFECITCTKKNSVAMTANISLAPALLTLDGALTVTVVDSDANLNSSIAETTTVTISQTYRQPLDSRIVTVTETDTNTGIFTGSLRTSSVLGSGFLYAPQGARINATYIDTHPVPSTVRSASSRIASAGSISLSPSPLNPNGTLIVTVDDADLDTTTGADSTGADSVVVKSIVDTFNPNGHTLVLRETGGTTGVFTGTILTRTPAGTQAGLPVDNAKSGTEITAEYLDQAPLVMRVAVVRIASVGTLSVTPDTLESGKPISILVADDDLNLNRTVIEQASLVVRQSSASRPDVVEVRTLFALCASLCASLCA
jgi:hypothetical protein